jgi:hypothetical protein
MGTIDEFVGSCSTIDSDRSVAEIEQDRSDIVIRDRWLSSIEESNETERKARKEAIIQAEQQATRSERFRRKRAVLNDSEESERSLTPKKDPYLYGNLNSSP